MTKHRTLQPILFAGLDHYKGTASEATARCAVSNLCRILGQVRLTRFDLATVRGYRRKREAEGSSAATRNREIGVLRAILRRERDEGRLRQTLPTAWATETEKVRTRWLTSDEARAIFAAVSSPWASDVIRVLLSTGARTGELLGARSGDLSFSDDGRRATILIPDPKEGDAKVLVATNGAVAALRRLLATSEGVGSKRITARPTRSGKASSNTADYAAVRWHLQRAVAKAGIPEAHLHDLRRTYGSWAIQAGATLEQTGQALGHKSLETTRRTYARIDEKTRADVGELVTSRLA